MLVREATSNKAFTFLASSGFGVTSTSEFAGGIGAVNNRGSEEEKDEGEEETGAFSFSLSFGSGTSGCPSSSSSSSKGTSGSVIGVVVDVPRRNATNQVEPDANPKLVQLGED